MSISDREAAKLRDLLKRNADLDYIQVERSIVSDLLDFWDANHDAQAGSKTPKSRQMTIIDTTKNKKDRTDD